MLLGKVVGSVVSTRKNEKLVGCKLTIVEPIYGDGEHNKLVTVDNIGAGIGDYVLVVTGSAARLTGNLQNAPVDAAIVGIVDEGEGLV